MSNAKASASVRRRLAVSLAGSLVVSVIACDGSGGGGGGVTGAGGATWDGETDPPQPGYYDGEAIQFRLLADGTLTDFDVKLSCTCDGAPNVLDGRIREGGALDADGSSLVPIVNRAAALRIEGVFEDATHVAGTYSYQCCADVAWTAYRIEEGEVPGGLCMGQPETTPVPVAATEAGATLHWIAPETCIALSRSPELSAVTDRIVAAAEAWESVACSALCFDAPSEASEGPFEANDRRVHFTLADDAHPVPAGARASTSVRVRPFDGRITGATIILAPAVVADDRLDELMRQLGRALGFEQAPDGVDSVLAASGAAQRLTAADESALCALYGRTPYCME